MSAARIGFQLCADFSLFPVGTQLGPSFSLAGFDFVQPSGGILMFVSSTGGSKGLQFPDQGIEITLPVSSASVNLRIGTFAGPVDIAALDSTGAVVRNRTVPGNNQYNNVRLSAPDIASLTLSGGMSEGVLASICVSICVC
ncbi:hypothetical protein [Myxococcus sp. RHSTA-1-4]|uniref:hypothetical protein n=1 Tax=Myxococcus sp. RHSTA-1-4 TaxID=2874601 RepID=UPI001CC148EE|nr:hypothetical protein [Myxococcus sp. RHSTA-1-4]MBZ4421098.1 hypothetical protein [Myxococcus sp. RHSTA-1-4]